MIGASPLTGGNPIKPSAPAPEIPVPASRLRKNGDPTLKDVARLAGVSLATVSNVVNGKFGKMTEETRSSVERAIASLSYRPAANARALRMDRRFIAGMLIIDPAASFLANPFIAQLVAGYSNELWANGYSCLINGVRPEQIESSTFVRYAQTDGLCVFQSGPANSRGSILQRLSSLGEPIVAIEEPDLPEGDLASVRQDNFGSAAFLAGELLRRGARTIRILAPNWIWPAMQARVDGIEATVRSKDPKVGVSVVSCGDGQADEAENVISRLLTTLSPGDCLIAGTDRMFHGLVRSLARHNTGSPPLLGAFRGIGDTTQSPPGLVTVYQPAYELGAQAAAKLMKRIADGAFEEIETVIPFTTVPADAHNSLLAAS